MHVIRSLPTILLSALSVSTACNSAEVDGNRRLSLAQAESDAVAGAVAHAGAMHQGSLASFRVVPRHDGRGVRTLVGRFSSTLSGSHPAAHEDGDVANVLRGFLNENATLFGVEWLDGDDLRLSSVSHEQDFSSFEFVQERVGIEIEGGGLVVAMNEEGDVISVSGLVMDGAPTSVHERSAGDVLAAVSPSENEVIAVNGQLVDGGGQVVGFIKPLYSREMDPVWHVMVDDVETLVKDGDLTILRHGDTAMPYTTTSCNFRHLNFPRDSNNDKSTSGITNDGDGDALKVPVNDIETCGANDWLGNCPWQLLRSDVRNGLERVHDVVNSEAEDFQSCSDTTVPAFLGGTSSTRWLQQNAFFWGARMRVFLEQNVYAAVTPNSTALVEYRVNDSGGSRYSSTYKDIYVNAADGNRIHVYQHEMGHHAVWSYGFSSVSSCSNNVNENQRLHETMAQVMTMIAIADDDTMIDMNYNAQAPAETVDPHKSGIQDGIVDNSNDCDALDVHNEGLGMEQAFWELLYNRNCSGIGSCSNVTSVGNSIWTDGPSHDAVISRVADGVAFALKNTPDTTTYEDILAQFDARIRARFGNATADRVDAVFFHHGR